MIVADPPWAYDLREEDGTHRGRTDYPTMKLWEISGLGKQVQERAAKDAVLLLWTTNAFLANGAAATVVNAWGFTGKTVLTWGKRTDDGLDELLAGAKLKWPPKERAQLAAKLRPILAGRPRIGLGHYLRNSTEHCIIATRGTPLVDLGAEDTLLLAPRREHSRKPDEFFALVEKVFPGSKLEMFSREARPGWAAWGAEPERFKAEASP